MKISELTESIVGKKIRVTKVAPSQAEEMGYVDDTVRLTGQTGRAAHFHSSSVRLSQLRVDWDNKTPGSLSLAGNDEIEILS
jgi:hypothetical protein